MENLLEIQSLAKECLNCKKPMCKKGCPISTNIPEFIRDELKINTILDKLKTNKVTPVSAEYVIEDFLKENY